MDDLDSGNNAPRSPRTESMFLKAYMELDAVVNANVPETGVTQQSSRLNSEYDLLQSKLSFSNMQHFASSQRPPNNGFEPSYLHTAPTHGFYFTNQQQSAPTQNIDAIVERQNGEPVESSWNVCRNQTCEQSQQLPTCSVGEQQRHQDQNRPSALPQSNTQQQSQMNIQSPIHKAFSSPSRKQDTHSPNPIRNSDQNQTAAASKHTMSPLTANPGTSIATSSSTALFQQQSNTDILPSLVESETNITDLAPANAGLVRHMNPEQRALVLMKRKIRNRLSAKRSRVRRQEAISELAQTVMLLREESERIKVQCEQAVKENQQLKEELQQVFKREE